MKKLNLGCGQDIKKGYINLDSIQSAKNNVDVVHDLNKFPYPFKDNEFDLVLLISVLEHLENTPKVIEELHRITKSNGKIIIEVPHFSSFWAWTDITHKRPYSFFSLYNYDIKNQKLTHKGESLEIERNPKFIIKQKLQVSVIFKLFGIGLFANKFPYIYERFFAYLFPTGNIIFELSPIKRATAEN